MWLRKKGRKMKHEDNQSWSIRCAEGERTKQWWELEIGDVGWGPVSSMEEAATGTKRDASSVWCTTRMKASPCLDAAKPNMSTEHWHWFVAGWCGKVGCWPNQNTWKWPKYIKDPFQPLLLSNVQLVARAKMFALIRCFWTWLESTLFSNRKRKRVQVLRKG